MVYAIVLVGMRMTACVPVYCGVEAETQSGTGRKASEV